MAVQPEITTSAFYFGVIMNQSELATVQLTDAYASASERFLENNNQGLAQFTQYFQAELATSSPQKTAIYQLRHQVYCEELAYEACKPDRLECDHYDERSLHCYLSHRSSDRYAGTVRLITCEQNVDQLPVEHYFAGRYTSNSLTPSQFPRNQICEISRLAVPEQFRRRLKNQPAAKDLPQLDAVDNRNGNQYYRYIAISLYLIAMILSVKSGRYHAFVTIEPALARVLYRIGFHFIQIGEPIELNGQRAPYYLDMRTVCFNLNDDYLQLKELLIAQLKDGNTVQFNA